MIRPRNLAVVGAAALALSALLPAGAAQAANPADGTFIMCLIGAVGDVTADPVNSNAIYHHDDIATAGGCSIVFSDTGEYQFRSHPTAPDTSSCAFHYNSCPATPTLQSITIKRFNGGTADTTETYDADATVIDRVSSARGTEVDFNYA